MSWHITCYIVDTLYTRQKHVYILLCFHEPKWVGLMFQLPWQHGQINKGSEVPARLGGIHWDTAHELLGRSAKSKYWWPNAGGGGTTLWLEAKSKPQNVRASHNVQCYHPWGLNSERWGVEYTVDQGERFRKEIMSEKM